MSPDSCQNLVRYFNRCATLIESSGVSWNLHHITGTEQFAVMREDAVFDVPLPIAVRNIHSMSAASVLYRAQDYWMRETS